jgi:hypothetical protein
VLIWIAALVALYLGALEWLQARAPEPAPAVGEPAGVAAAGAGVDGVAPPVAATVVPAPRPGPVPPGSGAERPAGGTLLATAVEAASQAPAAAPAPAPPEPLVPEALTPETITTLNERLDLLVRMGSARDAGVLTEEEFRRQKSRLLGGS